jgi:hypothetical protein
MGVIHHQHQRIAEATMGLRGGSPRQILAADQSQDTPVRRGGFFDCNRIFILGRGLSGSRLFSSFTHCARSSSSSDLTRIGRVFVSSLRTSGLPQFRSPRVGVRRGGCAFVAAPTSRLINPKISQNACKHFADRSECHFRRLSSGGFDTHRQTREANNAVPEKRTFGS